MKALLLGITQLLLDLSSAAMARGEVATAERLMDASDATLDAALSVDPLHPQPRKAVRR